LARYRSSGTFTDLGSLAELTNLSRLILSQRKSFADLEHLAQVPRLRSLWLPSVSAVRDFTPLAALSELETVRIYSDTPSAVFEALSELPSLVELELHGEEAMRYFAVSPHIIRNLKRVTFIDGPDDLTGSLADKIQHITTLRFIGPMPSSIEPLRRLHDLRVLELLGYEDPDLSPLLELPSLERISFNRAPTPAECRILTLLPEHVSVANLHHTISRTKLKNLAAK
jgi:hypothetical protein